jgi:hypothetical protein
LEFAVEPKTRSIWLANILDYNGCKNLMLYSNGKMTTKLETRKIFDDVDKPFKKQSFYKSENILYFNPRYSPYVYQLEGKNATPFIKIQTNHFITSKILSDYVENINTMQVLREKKLIDGFNFFCRVNDWYVGEIRHFPWSSDFIVYDITTQKGKQIESIPANPGIFTQNNDYIVGVISADVFKRMYSQLFEDVSEDDNPILVKVKLN